MRTPVAVTVACLVSVLLLLVADRQDFAPGRVLFKMISSTCFVLVAVSNGALNSPYGQFVLGALALGWIGDALLLSVAPAAFMGGLAAFLLAHVLFAAAFIQGTLSLPALATATGVAVAVGVTVLRWLLPHTPRDFKVPVAVYVVVILVMCVAAAGHAVASRRWAVLFGATLFAASDISVARDRFVEPGFVNRLWGWPTYFLAQIILAWSVANGESDA